MPHDLFPYLIGTKKKKRVVKGIYTQKSEKKPDQKGYEVHEQTQPSPDFTLSFAV